MKNNKDKMKKNMQKQNIDFRDIAPKKMTVMKKLKLTKLD